MTGYFQTPTAGRRAFTLVELLAALTVVTVLILVLVGMTNQTNKIWRSSRARITAFQQARNAFERMTSNLSQATLNTYLDYYDASGTSRADLFRKTQKNSGGDPYAFSIAAAGFHPVTYDRASDLQFVCGSSENGDNPLLPVKPEVGKVGTRPTHALFFQCPIGHVSNPYPDSKFPGNDFKNLSRVLNAVGYYVEFANGNDKNSSAGRGKIPGFINRPTPLWRYRLMELNQPSQYLNIYSPSVSYFNPSAWFSLAVDPTTPTAPVFVVADNIIALVVRPKAANPVPNALEPTEIAPNYAYDTKQYFAPPSAGNPAGSGKLSKNQLPPLVQVTLVAIDVDSATRLANQYGGTPPPLVNSMLFTDVLKYDADLAALEKVLQDRHLAYRTFVTDVSVPNAKWSETR